MGNTEPRNKCKFCVVCHATLGINYRTLCDTCGKIPKCKTCGILMRNVSNFRKYCSTRCTNWFRNVKPNCITCNVPIKAIRFLTNGNFCVECSEKAGFESKARLKRDPGLKRIHQRSRHD